MVSTQIGTFAFKTMMIEDRMTILCILYRNALYHFIYFISHHETFLTQKK